ncbi:MAG: methyltransferase domain-containing protein [Myxococcota bacterium]
MARPWWIDRVAALLVPGELGGHSLGALWHLREQLHFVRDNVEPSLLAVDVETTPDARATWGRFEQREAEVALALARAGDGCADGLRTGAVGPSSFRAHWQGLGFARHAEGAGTPADDYLDALFDLSRRAAFATPMPFALLNLATRAARISDFLSVLEPGRDDVVFDLGSGSGKLALTVAASTVTAVRGVEIDVSYAEQARRSAAWLGLRNVSFESADVRDVALSGGSIFYLYYPFHGRVAREVAQKLGALAREKDITIYAAGPLLEYGEFFLAEVEGGALSLTGRRGEFGEVLHLVSRRG